jgi:hypothetical protein
MYLFERSLAFERRLSPDEFIATVGQSIKASGELVAQKLALIEGEIIEIANVLIVKDATTAQHKKKKMFLKELLELEPKLLDLKRFYGNILYIGVYNSVWNSLKCLVESCGYELDNPDYFLDETDEGDLDERRTTVSSLGPNDLVQKYMRVKSAEMVLSDHQRRPVSVTTAILRTNWSDERKLSKAFLK